MLNMIAGCGGCITIPEEKQRATERLGGRYFSPHEKRFLPVEWTGGFQLTFVGCVSSSGRGFGSGSEKQ